MADAFIRQFAEFTGFAGSEDYHRVERRYKVALARRFREEVTPCAGDPLRLAEAYVRVLTTKPADAEKQNLIDQRYICSRLTTLGGDALTDLGGSLWRLLEAAPEQRASVLERFVTEAVPLLRQGRISGPEDAARQLGSLVLMLIAPETHLFVRRVQLDAQYRHLTGSPFPKSAPHAHQQQVTDAFGRAIFAALDERGWAPQDMIDVQGFLWVTRNTLPATGGQTAVSHPLNTILYGPPGTGKTYRTARMAVEICDGEAPAGRTDLMRRYGELSEAGRIGFITFHQSFAYEDFVEGLRPETGERDEGGPGFRLEVRDGVLKDIAKRAAAGRGRLARPDPAPQEERRVFKMSLGRANDPDDAHKFESCVAGNYIALGYGGDIDWSPSEYDSAGAIKRRWKVDHPDAEGFDTNIKTITTLRNQMRKGSLVIVSDGNLKFRAIAEVTGDYYFEPQDDDAYQHRRPVKWLWRSDQSLPVESIYRKGFVQLSVYRLKESEIIWPALNDLIGAENNQGAPQPHVLIIDEINRANVSKTFGELITLLEEDKRAGAINALKVRLPYSGEEFELPGNLYMLGTMNTADRSIALLDAALRRRFDFLEVAPDPRVLPGDVEGVDVRRLLEGINQRLEYLFDRDHLIGHAYFMGASTLPALSAVMRTKVAPLLVEYFHEDWEKVRAVLNERDDAGAFVRRIALAPPRTMENGEFEADALRWRYMLVEGPYEATAFEQLYP